MAKKPTTYDASSIDVNEGLDDCVNKFAQAMKDKLRKKSKQGFSGWDDEKVCSQKDLSLMLKEHITKGDPIDVANFCMMLFIRKETII